MHPGSLLAHRDQGKIREGRGTRAGAARAPLIPRPGDRQDVLKSQQKKKPGVSWVLSAPSWCWRGFVENVCVWDGLEPPKAARVGVAPVGKEQIWLHLLPKIGGINLGGVCSRLHRDPSESQLGLTPPLRAHTAAGGAFPLKPPPKISNSQASSSSSAGPAGSGGRGGFLGSPGESFTSVSPQERGPPPGALRSDSSPNGSDMDRR